VRSSTLRSPATLFIASSLLVVGVCLAVVRSQAFASNRAVAAWGVTFDLTITIPLLYWFFVVRPRHARPLTIAPVFVAGTILAAMLLPRTEQQFMGSLRTFVVPVAEILLVGALARRILRARREWPGDGDASARIHSAASTLAGEGRVADVIASEIAVLYYAIFCWRKKPADERGRAFTIHERCGWASIVVCILVMIVAESIGMHLLLRRWTPAAAWFWTALDLWAIAWLVGDYHALRLRRSTIDADALRIRCGLRWSAEIPLSAIESITEIRVESEWRRKDVLKLAILDEPRWLITLRDPVVCRGIAGIRKTVRAIALLPDDDAAVTSLRHACAAGGECAPRP
jgi:hypothetical protein